MFQLGAQRLGALIRRVVAHRMVDESAALTRLRHPVNGLNRTFRQNDVDAFAHCIHILYTTVAQAFLPMCLGPRFTTLHVT